MCKYTTPPLFCYRLFLLDTIYYLLYTNFMSYHIYQTEGVILSSHLAGESNRFYYIYTEEFGLIGVWGQGVRKLESKLRFNLQDFSHVRIHLIRGKNMWKLTDVDRISSFQKL